MPQQMIWLTGAISNARAISVKMIPVLVCRCEQVLETSGLRAQVLIWNFDVCTQFGCRMPRPAGVI